MTRLLTQAEVVRVPAAELVALLRAGQVEAVASNRTIALAYAAQVPGARVLADRYAVQQQRLVLAPGRSGPAWRWPPRRRAIRPARRPPAPRGPGPPPRLRRLAGSPHGPVWLEGQKPCVAFRSPLGGDSQRGETCAPVPEPCG